MILLNLGGTSAGLDIHLYPKQDMDGGTVTLAQGVGGQKASFPNAMYAGDDVALLASSRECTRNGRKEKKYGFFQYSAAWDSKHIVSLPQGKSAQLLYSMQEIHLYRQQSGNLRCGAAALLSLLGQERHLCVS